LDVKQLQSVDDRPLKASGKQNAIEVTLP